MDISWACASAGANINRATAKAGIKSHDAIKTYASIAIESWMLSANSVVLLNSSCIPRLEASRFVYLQ